MKLDFIFVPLILLVGLTASGQVKQLYRLEEEIKGYEEGYTVISLRKEGLALVHEKDRYAQGKRGWEVEFVDSTLTRYWTTEVNLKKGMILVGYEYNPGHLYLLMREGLNDFHNFTLVTIPFHEQIWSESKINFELNFKLTHFTMSGTSAIFGGEINGEPAVLLYNKQREHPKVLPGLFMKNIYLLDVRANQNQSFNVLLAEQRQKEEKKIILRTYDHEGNMLLEDIVPIEARYTIQSGITSALERDELLVIGTYGATGGRESFGFYSFIVDPFNDQTVNYQDFGSFDHFLDYLSARKASKIKSKIQKQRIDGQVPDYSAYITPFRIEESSDGYYVFSEMYYPSHSFSSYPYSSGYYSPYTYGYSPYGYNPYGTNPYSRVYNNTAYPYSTTSTADVKMVQSMVVKFNAQVQPVKSVSMKLNVRQNGLEQLGDFLVCKDSILIAYKKDGELVYRKEMPESELTSEKDAQDPTLSLQAEGEVLKNESDETGAVRYWFGNHMYVWGYQTIKDTRNENFSTRHIFYVSRITVD